VARFSLSVVLNDVGVGPVEQILVRMELVFQQASPKGILDLPLPCCRLLPARKASGGRTRRNRTVTIRTFPQVNHGVAEAHGGGRNRVVPEF